MGCSRGLEWEATLAAAKGCGASTQESEKVHSGVARVGQGFERYLKAGQMTLTSLRLGD